MTLGAYVNAVGLWAPGLPGWRGESRAVLTGKAAYRSQSWPEFTHLPLPPNEARRLTFTLRLALQVAQEAMAAGPAAAGLGAVFACSGGNAEALDKIFTALALPQRPVSPAQFHHSVHNAALGYWSIAAAVREPATSIGAFDASFAAGLLEACGLVEVERRPVLLVAYDVPPPQPLLPFRPVGPPFASALLLGAESDAAGLGRLRLEIARGREEDRMADARLERLRTGNPAARSLPLLTALARGRRSELVLPYLPALQVCVEHQACC